MPTKKRKEEDKIPVEIAVCSNCNGNKVAENGIECPACQGVGVFLRAGRNGIYYWGEKLFGISPTMRSVYNAFPKIIHILIYVLSIATFLYGIYFVVVNNPDFFELVNNDLQKTNAGDPSIMNQWFALIFAFIANFLKAFLVLIEKRGGEPLLFWISVLCIMYIYYHLKIKNASEKEISPLSENFRIFYDKKATEPKKSVDVSNYTSPNAKNILTGMLDLAHKKNQAPSLFHLARMVAQDLTIKNLFKRLEIDSGKFIADMDDLIKNIPQNNYYHQEGILNGTILSPEAERMILLAFEETFIVGFSKIETESLFLSLMRDDFFQKYFKEINIGIKDVRNTVLWTRNWSRVRVRMEKPRKVKHTVMNRAWTARVTPELDRFSYDLTDHARAGLTGYIINREKEIDNLMRILERTSKNNALLIGEEGSGRTSIVKALANRMMTDQVLPTLQDKRLVVLDLGSLVSGARAGSDLELRIREVLEDMGKSGNIILYIPDIHNIAAAGSGEGFDASKVFAPIFSQGMFQIIGSTDYRNYHRYIEPRADFANSFDMIKIEELDEENTMKVLAAQAKIIEYRENIIMTYGAIKKATELSKRYITDKLLPGKAIDLLSETAVEARRRGPGSVLKDKDIMEVITEKTGIPLMDISSSEAEKLLSLEEKLHQRVIGQFEAVKAISSAIRRVRVGMKHESKPIGAFLFLGPTGVGKTELAKALAEAYYGDEKAMIRIDMSEYQTVNSVEKLIGSSYDLSEMSSGGALTEAVKRKPFSLILLDELEKANKSVLNLFLQVFDDGRLTDNLGRTVDFTNTIIIATSNAGSQIIRKIVTEKGSSSDRMFQLLEPYLLQSFAPEFLNRFTAKIIFRSLSEEEVMAIARLQINGLAKRMDKAQGIKIEISEDALKKISSLGYSPEFGARFLQRTIQERVENLIANKFLRGDIKRGAVFKIGVEDI